MAPSVSILMAFDCKCNQFTHEHFAGAHTFHVELEFYRSVGNLKLKYPEKNLWEQRREPTTNSTHIMVSIMVYIKSINTLNQKTAFFQ